MEQPNDMERQRRIEAFVRGRLSEADRGAFERELGNDAELRADVDLERTMQDVMRHEKSLHFRDVVSQASMELDAVEHLGEAASERKSVTPVIPISRKRNWAWLAAAASVALVVGAYSLWQASQPTYEELAMTGVENFNFSTVRGGGVATGALPNLDKELQQLIVQKAYERYLERSTFELANNPQFAAAFGADVKKDRVRVLLLLGRTEEALLAIKPLQEKEPGECNLLVLEGFSYALEGKKGLASDRLRQADRKGCLDDAAKALIQE